MPEAIQQQQQAADPYANLSEHDRKMLEVAQKNGVRVVVSDSQSGSRTDYTMTAAIESNATQEPAPSASKVERPAHIPEKFWNAEKGEVNVEAMAKSYAELEASRSKPSIAQPGTPAAPAAAPAVKPAAAPQIDMGKAVDAVLAAQAELHAATDDAAKAAAQTKLDAAKAAVVNAQPAPVDTSADLSAAISTAAQEYAQNGSFTEETLAKMEARGITRDYAAAYLDGLKARAQVIEFEAWDAAGGKKQFGVMADWAQANLSAEQITEMNAGLTSGDATKTVAAVKNLKALYDAGQGVQPTNQVDPTNKSTAVEMFKSSEEMTKAMSDPKYGRDPAYTAEVERKLAASVKANVNLGVTAMF